MKRVHIVHLPVPAVEEGEVKEGGLAGAGMVARGAGVGVAMYLSRPEDPAVLE